MVVGPWVSHSCMVVVDQADSKEPPQSSRTRRCEESERRHLLGRPLPSGNFAMSWKLLAYLHRSKG